MTEENIIKLNGFSSFAQDIISRSSVNINNCYQCKKCTAGCPISFAMDIQPHQIIRYIQLGFEEQVLTSKTIWLCAACETCGTRCANGIRLPEVMDTLRQRAMASPYRDRIAEKGTWVFHEELLSSVKSNGRTYEAMMMAKSRIRSGRLASYFEKGEWIADLMLFITMLKKGKMGLLPHRIRDRKAIRTLFKNTTAAGRG